MSMELMVKAMKTKVGNPLRKLVLIKLADNANDMGECWPSYQHIADHCEISRTTVKVHVRELEKVGLLRREFRRKGELNQSNLFHLTLEGGAGAALPGAGAAPGGGASAAPRTSHSFEPVIEPILGASAPPARGTKKSPPVDEQFEAAWGIYPKREGSNPKNKAQAAWNARRSEDVSTEDMLQGVIRYAAYCAAKGSIGTEFVMQAQRFFGNGREYENDWAATTGGKPSPSGPNFDDKSWADNLYEGGL